MYIYAVDGTKSKISIWRWITFSYIRFRCCSYCCNPSDKNFLWLMSALQCMSCFYITRKLQQNSLTVSRNDREKLFCLLMSKICVTLLNKLLYSKCSKLRRRYLEAKRRCIFSFPHKNTHLFGRVLIGYTWYNSLEFNYL